MSQTPSDPGMVRHEIVLPDGRLLWFYTFAPSENGALEDGEPT